MRDKECIKDWNTLPSEISHGVMGGGEGVLSYKRLMGMCRWIDYNGVAFSTELLEGVARFLILG